MIVALDLHGILFFRFSFSLIKFQHDALNVLLGEARGWIKLDLGTVLNSIHFGFTTRALFSLSDDCSAFIDVKNVIIRARICTALARPVLSDGRRCAFFPLLSNLI